MASNTLSTMSIGFVGDASQLMGSIEKSVGGVQRLANSASGLLVPAFSNVNRASSQAEIGMGRLEHLVEVLGLRVLATSTQVSHLAQMSHRLRGSSRGVQSSASAAATAIRDEAQAAAELTQMLGTLSRQGSSAEGHSQRLQVINEGQELSAIRRIRAEIRLLGEDRARQMTGRRISQEIPAEIASLQQDRSGPYGTQSADAQQRINQLKQEQIRLTAQLAGQETAELGVVGQITAKHQEVQALISAEGQRIAKNAESHREIAAARQEAARAELRPDPSLAATVRNHREVARQVKLSTQRQLKLNAQMKESVGDEERLVMLEGQLNEEKDKGAALEARQLQLQKQGLGLVSDAATIEARIAESKLRQAGVTKPQLANEARINQEIAEHNALLTESVRLGKMNVLQASLLGKEYAAAANQSLATMNARLTASQRGAGRLNFMVQNLGYGIEDAASQMGTRGLAGAIGAASNNATAMIAQLQKPMLLLGASVGVALLQMAVQTGALQKAMEALGLTEEDLFKKNEDLIKSYDEMERATNRVIDQALALKRIREEDSAATAKRKSESLAIDLKREEAALKASLAKQLRERDQARVEEIKKEKADIARAARQQLRDSGNAITNSNEGVRERSAENLRIAQEKINKLKKEEEAIAERELARANDLQGTDLEVQKHHEKIADLKEQQNVLTGRGVVLSGNERDVLREEIELQRDKQRELMGELTLSDQIARNDKRRADAIREYRALRPGSTQEQILANTKERLRLEKEITATEAERKRIKGIGDGAVSQAEELLASAKENAGVEETGAERRRKALDEYRKQTDLAHNSGRLSDRQRRDALVRFQGLQALGRKKEELDLRKKKLMEEAKAISSVPQVQSSVEAGSAEASAIFAQAYLDDKSAQNAEPVVAAIAETNKKLDDLINAAKNAPTVILKKK